MERAHFFSKIWKDRPDLEHQQAILRVCVGACLLIYLLYTIFRDGIVSDNDVFILLTAALFFISAFSIIVWLIFDTGISVIRRVIGILTDLGATTAALYFHGVLAAPLFVLYLWVTFGNGFRYGQKYLAFSAILGCLGFSFVTFFSGNSFGNSYVNFGLFTGLIVLPLYVSSLLKQLTRSMKSAERANRAKSNFLATMSHEIRTPLNGLVGITHLLDQTELDQKQSKYVGLISRSSEWLLRVITDGLDFSKIEAGELILQRESFHLPDSLKEVISYIQKSQDEKIELRIEIDEDLPEYVIGDQQRLIQILRNLLSNGFKFTKQGYVSLSVGVTHDSKNETRIYFVVEDTGMGISEENKKILFQPFKRTDSSQKDHVEGAGLGLSITHRLIALMGGDLTLKSTPGNGSRFSFTITFKKSILATGQEVSFIEGGKWPWLRKPRLLLAEDHEINQEVILHQLEDMGCEVTLAANGREAIEKMDSQEFDLVFMDCQMPVMDGYAATEKIRQAEQGNGNKTPIIALTAHLTIDDRKRCFDSGMDDYLGKPFRSKDLWQLLNKWLSNLLIVEGVIVPGEKERVEKSEDTGGVKESDRERRKLIHDLRNALFAINGSAEISLRQAGSGELDEKIHENLLRIQKAADKATELVKDLSK